MAIGFTTPWRGQYKLEWMKSWTYKAPDYVEVLLSRISELEAAIEDHHYEKTLRTRGFNNDWVDLRLYKVMKEEK